MSTIDYAALGYRTPLHPMPEITEKWRYDHCPLTYRKRDPQWEAMTSGGTVFDGLLRLVSGWDGRTFSRGPDSFISLDTYSLGIAHWWAETAPELITLIGFRLPELAEYAWGLYGEALEDEIDAIADKASRGKQRLSRSLHWLAAGWYEIARHPDVVSLQAGEWRWSYAEPAVGVCLKYGWNDGVTLACLARVANSRGAGRMRRWAARASKKFAPNQRDAMLDWLMGPEMYGHSERLDMIRSMDEFTRSIDVWHGSMQPAPVVRTDGTVPAWVGMLERGEPLTSGMCEVRS